ncbi:MAG: hypothetical protein WBC04_14710 [Candidatus Acidiferrales bacterium]
MSLSGSISSLGSQYVIGLNAVNCQTGDSLAQEQTTANGKEQVLKALDEAATKLRGKVGESLSTIQKFDTPLAAATTPSLEALKAFSLAAKTASEKGDAAAIPFNKRAIELDPNFASAYAGLGISYSNLGEAGLASEYIQRAYELRDRASEREKLSISAAYYMLVTGELDKTIQTYELWAEDYPRDEVPHFDLGFNYAAVGQNEKAEAETIKAVRLNPNDGSYYANLVSCYVALNHLDEARSAYQQGTARISDIPQLHMGRYAVSFLEGDTAEMQRQVAWAAGKPGAEDSLLAFASFTEEYYGHLGKGQELLRRAMESARRSDEKEAAALYETGDAQGQADFGNSKRATQEVGSALALAPTRDVQVQAALASARAGDSARAQAMTDDLANFGRKKEPEVADWRR